MNVSPLAWAAFVAFVLALLALDLAVLRRGARAATLSGAAALSAFWIGLGLSFTAVVWAWGGADAAQQYIAGYLIEESLSADNVFVFAVVLGYFAVPAEHQGRVLLWGVLGAIAMRGVLIVAGTALIHEVHWSFYVLGAFLLLTAARMARRRPREVDPSRNAVVTLLRRVVPLTDGHRGGRFVVREDGRRRATPLLVALVAVETTDLVFATDSIPAIFAVTTDPFIVFSSNLFAILGLRALYFVLAGMLDRFTYLGRGLAVILALAGAKLVLIDTVHIPTPASLAVIAAVLAASVTASLLAERRAAREQPRTTG